MEPLEYLALINGAMALTEALLPKLKQLKLSGAISDEEQAAVLARFNALKAKGDAAFQGPEWEVTPVPPASSTIGA